MANEGDEDEEDREPTRVTKLRQRHESSTQKIVADAGELAKKSDNLAQRSSRIPREVLRETLNEAASAVTEVVRGFAVYCRQFEGVERVAFSASSMTLFLMISKSLTPESFHSIRETIGGRINWRVVDVRNEPHLPRDALDV